MIESSVPWTTGHRSPDVAGSNSMMAKVKSTTNLSYFRYLSLFVCLSCSPRYPHCPDGWSECNLEPDPYPCNTFFKSEPVLAQVGDTGRVDLAPGDPEAELGHRIYVIPGERNILVNSRVDADGEWLGFWCSGRKQVRHPAMSLTSSSACGNSDLTSCTFGNSSDPHPRYVDPRLLITNEEAVLLYTDPLGRRIRVAWAFCGGTLPDASAFQCPSP